MVETLHGFGYVFGDLRPSNIMFSGVKLSWSILTGPESMEKLFTQPDSERVSWTTARGGISNLLEKEHDLALLDHHFSRRS